MIKGETKTVAITPMGEKLPNNFKESGAVKIWAPQEAERESEKYEGKSRIRSFVR